MFFNRKFLMLLITASLVYGLTSEFSYGASEKQLPYTNTSNLTDIFLDNTSNQSNTLQTQINNWIQPIIQIQSEIQNNLTVVVQNINSTDYVENNSTIISNNPAVNNGVTDEQIIVKFHEIQIIPYNEKTMNCEIKSKLFADYLLNNGAKQIKLVVIEHESGKYSHEFVEWNDHYYDPCTTELSYTLSKESYLEKLRQIGFTGLVITSPYTNSMI
jgi:hypothetical protein